MGKVPETGATDLRPLRRLTAQELKAYEQSRAKLDQFLESRDHFRLLRENQAELEAAARNTLAILPLESRPPLETESALRTLNRTFVNYLTSFRLFIDHTETRLKRAYGRSSVSIKAFEASRTEQRASSSAFRLMEDLRNFVQHCGMPYDQASVIRTLGNDEAGPPEVEIQLGCSQDRLRSNTRNPRLLKTDWQELPDPIPIHEYVQPATASIRAIDRAVCDAETPALRTAGARALDVTRSAFDDLHHGVVGIFSPDDELGTPICLRSLPWHLMVALRLVRRKHGPFGHYVSPL